MKIVYLANAGVVHFIRWYEYFINKGHEVHVISGNTFDLKYDLVIKGLHLHYLPEFKVDNRIISFGVNLLQLPHLLSILRKSLRDISPDIIHAHQIHPYGLWGALSGFKPFIVTPMGSDVIILANRYFAYKKITEYVMSKASLVTGDSLVIEDNCKKFGLRADYELIHNGVNLEKYSPATIGRSDIIRTKLGIDKSSPVIFFSRTFIPLQNIETIIRAIPWVLSEIPGCKFVFVHHCGYGDYEREMRALVRSLNIVDSVVFAGIIPHEDMPAYYQSADLLLSVPKSDSSPSAVYEAMACGVPTIINRLPWTQLAMRHLENTYIIDDVTPDQIAAAVKTLLDDGELKEQIVRGGLDVVKRHFSYHDNMGKMESLMASISNKSRGDVYEQ